MTANQLTPEQANTVECADAWLRAQGLPTYTELRAARPSDAALAPEGWKLVPITPTGVMKDAGHWALPVGTGGPWTASAVYQAMIDQAPVVPAAETHPDADRYFEEWWAADKHFGGDSRDYALRGFNAGLAMRSRATTPQACKLHHEDWRELYNEAYERCSFESFHKRALELIAENEQSSAAVPQAGANAQMLEDAIAHLNGLLDLCEQGSKSERREARSAIHAFQRRALIAANTADKTYFGVNTELSTEMVDKPVQRMSDAERDVLAERARQVSEEGWTPTHDDQNSPHEMPCAAAAYALSAAGRRGDGVEVWPLSWAYEWWKPTIPRRDLVKASALIIAEIERIDRAGNGDQKSVVST